MIEDIDVHLLAEKNGSQKCREKEKQEKTKQKQLNPYLRWYWWTGKSDDRQNPNFSYL